MEKQNWESFVIGNAGEMIKVFNPADLLPFTNCKHTLVANDDTYSPGFPEESAQLFCV